MSRLRECLNVLRWDASDLAGQLGYTENEIASWLDGRAVVPLAVAAWLEALVKAYRALPLPRQEQSTSTSDAPITAVECRERHAGKQTSAERNNRVIAVFAPSCGRFRWGPGWRGRRSIKGRSEPCVTAALTTLSLFSLA